MVQKRVCSWIRKNSDGFPLEGLILANPATARSLSNGVTGGHVRGCSSIIAGKRATRVALCALCLGLHFLSAAPGGFAQQPAPTSGPATGVDAHLSAALAKPGDLMLRQTDLSAALLTISEIWRINVVLGPDVQGQVYAQFVNTPLYQILDSILLPNELGYRPMGQSLVIMRLEQLGDLNPMFGSATLRLENVDPAELLPSVRLLCSPQGKVEAISAAGSLMVVDFPDRVARIRQFVEEIDRATHGKVTGTVASENGPLAAASFTPEFVSAASLQTAVETVLSAEGKVAVVDPENRLVVADQQERVELARQIVKDLDIPRRQVRITALIYDLSIEDIERLGINWKSDVKWRHGDDDAANNVFNIDSLLSVPVAAGAPDGSMAFMSLSRNFDITAVVKALQEAKDSRLLADPNVTVLDHENAQMSIIKEIPYQELTQTSAGGQIGTTAFREAGIKLEVTPHISSDGTIRMEVTPSFSRLTGFTPGAQAQPIIDRREASTVVRVADQQVLIIGGLRERNDTGDFNGLPYLKDIKTLNFGALFRGRETNVRESELVVFIMPEIVPTSHVGSCRHAVALQTGQQLLDQIPFASTDPPPERPVPCCPPLPIGPCRPSYTPYLGHPCASGYCSNQVVRLPPVHTLASPNEFSPTWTADSPETAWQSPGPQNAPPRPRGLLRLPDVSPGTPPQMPDGPSILHPTIPELPNPDPAADEPLRLSYGNRFRGS